MGGVVLLLACAPIAAAQQDDPQIEGSVPQQQPTIVMTTFKVEGGEIEKAQHGLALRIDDFSARAAEKATGANLPGNKRFSQTTTSYLNTWRRDLGGSAQRAVLSIDGGDKIALTLSHPRVEDGDLLFHASRSNQRDFRDAEKAHLPPDFISGTVQVYGPWYRIVARLNATRGQEYSCSGNWRSGPKWDCRGFGEATNTAPWNNYGYWYSKHGGRELEMTSHLYVIHDPDYPHMGTYHEAVLRGTSEAWGTNWVHINRSSYYTSKLGTAVLCRRHPVSGNDKNLVGEPGGPLRTQITFKGNFFNENSYILDVRGYLNWPFPPPERCHF
jgi:hypothetical protein